MRNGILFRLGFLFATGGEASVKTALRMLAAILALAGVYFCAGKLGLSLAYVHESASAVWPPSGIGLAALLLWGYRLWPGIFLGAFLVNLTTSGSLSTTLSIAFGNSLEAVLGAWLINYFADGAKVFERARNIFKFVLLAALLSTTVSATFGATSLTLVGFAHGQQYAAIWLTWWLGDMAGVLLIAPLMVIWLIQPFPELRSRRVIEAAGLLLALLAVGYVIFVAQPLAGLESMTILPLLWAAFRFGQRGAVTAAVLMSGIALAGTLQGIGPFATANPNTSLLHLQSFMGTVAMAALVLAAVTTEAKRAEQRLQVQDAISRILAETPDLKTAGATVLQVLCERAGWSMGSIWNVDRAANELSCVEVWHIPSLRAPEFEAITRKRKFTPGVGLPGRVWSTGDAAWISDVTKDSNFPRAPIAVKEGIHAAFGFPIKLKNEILGVIECFSGEVREPDDHFLQTVSDIGGQLGQFIDRKRAEELLSQAKEDLIKANEQLEKRVQERTADLEQANAALLKNIDEQKRLEEQLRQAQKMESIGTLAGGIAHDFNNVLNIIRGYATLASRQSSDSQVAESMQVINEEIDRGAAVVRQLLTLARKTEALLTRTDANRIVIRVSELLKQTFPKIIELKLHLDPALPPVLADPNQINQALLNICVNARDAMPMGGVLAFTTQVIDGSELRDRHAGARTERYVCIAISDTGTGMEADVRLRIFEPFFTTKGFGEGTGLGLAMVYGLIRNHNGLIDVESEPEHGTTFRLYLPALDIEEKPAFNEIMGKEAPPQEQIHRRGTVLVVEDEEAMVRLLKNLLRQAGYQVLAAADGEEAIELYGRHKEDIDIALVDLNLPKAKGSEVIRTLKQQNPRVKIIVASGYLEPEMKSQLLKAGVKDYIQKPYTVDDVIKRLQSMCAIP